MVTLQYHHAILLEKEDEAAQKAVMLCIIISVAFSVTILAVILIFGHAIAVLLNDKAISVWLIFLPIAIFFNGLNLALSTWTTRLKAFKLLSYNRVLGAVLIPLVSIGIGAFMAGPTGLIVAYLFSSILPTVLLFRFFFYKRKPVPVVSTYSYLMKKYKKLPFYTLPTETLSTFTHSLPLYFLNHFSGVAAVGYFNLSNRLLGMPSQTISASVAEVFRQKATIEYNHNGNCYRLLITTVKYLFLTSFLPFLAIMLFGPQLFAFAFGSKWAMAGQFSQILAFLFMLKFIMAPVSYVAFIAGKQEIDFLGTMVFFVSTVIVSFLALKFTSNIFTYLLVYVLNFTWIYLIMFFLNIKFSKGK